MRTRKSSRAFGSLDSRNSLAWADIRTDDDDGDFRSGFLVERLLAGDFAEGFFTLLAQV